MGKINRTLLFAAIVVFIGAFFFDVLQLPGFPDDSKEQPSEKVKELENPPGPFHVPKEGMHTVIGQSAKAMEKKFGKPQRVDPSAYGYEWWIYNKDAKHYLQIGMEDDKVVTIFALGQKLKTIPFPITKPSKDVLVGVPLDSNVSLKYKGGSYEFEIPEEDLNTRPLVRLGDVWAILYFDHFTQKLQGIRYLDAKTLIEMKPYALAYQGTFIKSKDMDRAAWKPVEEGEERQIFDMTNIIRERFDLGSLKWDEKAAEAAFLHSKDMAKNDYFSHDSPTEGNLGERLHKSGESYLQAGGNIAAKYIDGIAATYGWLNSEGHRKNLLHKTFTQLGVGVYEKHYTQNFVKPF